MNPRRAAMLMMAGLLPTPLELKQIIESLSTGPGIDQAEPIQPVGWEARHSTGKRCGHLHRDHGKACACAVRMGAGWGVVVVR